MSHSMVNWVWQHLEKTRAGGVADPRAAFNRAQGSDEWQEYGALLSWRGWSDLVNTAKRQMRSTALNELVDECGGQQMFDWMDGLASTSRGLLFSEDQTLVDFDEVTEQAQESSVKDQIRIKARKRFRDSVIHIWKHHPSLTLGEVLKRKGTR